jgi:hypothetical protein
VNAALAAGADLDHTTPMGIPPGDTGNGFGRETL